MCLRKVESAGTPGTLVELGEVGVDKAIVDGEKLGQGTVALDGVSEEMQGLVDHVFAEAFAMVEPVAVGIGCHEVDVVQLQPGVGEGAQEWLGLAVGEAAAQFGADTG